MLAAPLIMGGMKLVGGLLGGKKKEAEAKAAKSADRRRVNLSNQQKQAKLWAIQSILKGMQPSLGAGAPSYAFDRGAFTQLYSAPAAAMGVDPTKGTGYGTAGGVLDAAGQIAEDYQAGQALKKK